MKENSEDSNLLCSRSQEAVAMMERLLAWTGDRAGELGRPELEGAGQVIMRSGGHKVMR